MTNPYGAHATYLAIIAILIIVVVYLAAKTVKAYRTMKEIKTKFGLYANLRTSFPRKESLRKLSNGEILKERTYEEYKQEFDDLVERAIALGDFHSSSDVPHKSVSGKAQNLSDACDYSLRGGKRIRPIILMEVARAASKSNPSSVDPADAALAVEYLHVASLIIDDHPDFDNDDERRGRPSLHAEMGTATAQMAALSLLTGSFQNLCRQIDWVRDNCPEFKAIDRVGMQLCGITSQAIGASGAAGGQLLDTLVGVSPDTDYTVDNYEEALKIAQMKTASFFEVAFAVGWLIAGGDPDKVEDLTAAGRHFGVGFQIADDLKDMTEDASRWEAGKPGMNFANFYGEEESRRVIEQNFNACRNILREKKIFSPLWKEIFENYSAFQQESAVGV